MKKRFLGLLLAAVMVLTLAAAALPVASFAATGTLADPWDVSKTVGVDNVKATLVGGVLTVSGTGKMKNFSGSSEQPWASVRGEIKSVVVESGVTSIGDYAFAYFSNLENITIPEGVTTLGMYSFATCGKLTNVTIPKSVGSIATGAFMYCSALKTVTVKSESPAMVVANVFGDCTALEKIYVPVAKVDIYKTAIGWNTYSTKFVGFYEWDVSATGGVDNVKATLVDGVLTISGTGAMKELSNVNDVWWKDVRGQIKSAVVEPGVTNIGAYAFAKCSNLENVTISEGVTTLGTYSFAMCGKLTNVTIPQSVTAISNMAFYDCSALKTVTVKSESPATLASSSFDGTALETICVPASALATYQTTNGWIGDGIKNKLVGFYEWDVSATAGVDNVKATLVDGVFTVSGTGAMKGYTSSTRPWNNVRLQIKSVVVESGVTSIGPWAFMQCNNLENVTISEGVTTLGGNSFAMCGKLTNVTIPRSVAEISNSAFITCSALKTVIVKAEAPATLGTNVFVNCTALEKIYVPTIALGTYQTTDGWKADGIKEKLAGFYEWDVSKTVGVDNVKATLVGGVFTVSGTGAMKNVSESTRPWVALKDEIKSVVVESGVTSIGNYAFYKCSNLENVTIPEGVTTLGTHLFESCGKLTNVTIPQSVATIGLAAFSQCSALKTVTVKSETPATLGSSVFFNCTALEKIYVPGSALAAYQTATNWSTYSAKLVGVYEWDISKTAGTDNVKATLVDGVLTISGTGAMKEFGFTGGPVPPASWTDMNPTSIVIENGVTHIGKYAFYNCAKVTSVTIAESVESIDIWAFAGCTELETVTIPENVTTIGVKVFRGATKLKTVTVKSETPPELGTDAFYNCTALETIYVPANALATYQTRTGWKEDNIKNKLVGGLLYGDEMLLPWSDSTKLPTEAGGYFLTANVTLTDTWIAPNGATILHLNGFVIKQTVANKAVISVPATAELTVCDDKNSTAKHYFTVDETGLWTLDDTKTSSEYSVTGGVITGGTRTSSGAGILVYGTFTLDGGNIVGNKASSCGGMLVQGGTFTMKDGNIVGNTAGSGGGVYVYNATFEMKGGAIKGNTAENYGSGVYMSGSSSVFTMTGGEISGNKAGYGNVYMNSGKFEMSGGKIKDNTATANGGGVYMSGTGSVFTMTGGEISGNKAASNGGGVYMGGGAFTMSGGAISGNTATGNGGGVYMTGSSTKFTMTGGEIKDNMATSGSGGGVHMSNGTFEMKNGTISGNKASYGSVFVGNGTFEMSGGTIKDNTTTNTCGGVYMNGGTFEMSGGTISGNTTTGKGGGVYMAASSVFTMTGGEIKDNKATNNQSYGNGGGVYMNGGTFEMSGGKIKDNTGAPADTSMLVGFGGGVYVKEGTFKMTDGTISGNTATSKMNFGNGGGVYVYLTGTFEMTGGKITGNTAYQSGGGVFSAGKFTMTGGEISGNTATTDGGGVYTSGTITLGGTAKITGNFKGTGDSKTANNLCLMKGNTVTLGTDGNAPKTGMSVGISTPTAAAPTRTAPVTFTGTATAAAYYYFTPDDDNHEIWFETDHLELKLAKIPVEPPKALIGLVYNGKLLTGVAEAEGFTVTNGKMTGAGTYTATATLQEGYIWSDKTTAPKQIKWTIAKAKNPVTAPAVSASGSGRSISVTSNSTYEYRINGGAWQSSSSFDGLTPETNYTVEVRVKETANIKASEITKLTVNSGKTQHQKVSGPFLTGLVNAITVVVKTVMKLTWLFG